jgi:23S rRNA pseudouridine1911/1915/1917 synthase
MTTLAWRQGIRRKISWVSSSFHHSGCSFSQQQQQQHQQYYLLQYRKQQYHTPSEQFDDKLLPPTVVYSDNHILAINKPAGWHSVPNPPPTPQNKKHTPATTKSKCLLTYLKYVMRLGGGSQHDFLLPLHRIDQPCTGVLLFGKTSKAASRITKLWKNKFVTKDYFCIVQTSRIHNNLLQVAKIRKRTTTTTTIMDHDQHGEGWYRLDGTLLKSSNNSRSVKLIPIPSSNDSDIDEIHNEPNRVGRSVSIEFKVIPLDGNSIHPDYTLLYVRTKDGTRHVVRALLSQIGGCPIAGDIRYDHHQQQQPLMDKSVALHAACIHLHPQKLRIGTLSTFDFIAPIPSTWKKLFGLKVSQEEQNGILLRTIK